MVAHSQYPAAHLLRSRHAVLALVSCALLLTIALSSRLHPDATARVTTAVQSYISYKAPATSHWHFNLGPNDSYALKYSQPHSSFYQQLLPGVRYVTHYGYNGHANQFLSIYNAAYYALKTNRVYIIPSMFASHFEGDPLPLSAFFDLDRFMRDSEIPTVEWDRVKSLDIDNNAKIETLPCWSVMEIQGGYAVDDYGSISSHGMKLVPWALPQSIRAVPWDFIRLEELVMWDRNFENWNNWFHTIKQKFLPQNPVKEGQTVEDPSKNMKPWFDITSRLPSPQVVCYDNTFYLSAAYSQSAIKDLATPYETRFEGESDAWPYAGVHFHFNDMVNRRVDAILASTFGKANQPFIAIHVRRGDFNVMGRKVTLASYSEALTKVRDSLEKRLGNPSSWNGPGKKNFRDHGIAASDYPVLFTTDEDPSSEDCQTMQNDYGWRMLDSSLLNFGEQYEGWGGAILPTAVLSRASAFVGTGESTYSSISGLRVKYWNGGPVEMALRQ